MLQFFIPIGSIIYEPRHEISNNVACAISKTSDQPTKTHSLIRAFASPLNILCLSYDVASGSEIKPCNKIDKPLAVYRFTGKVMTSIITLRT